MKANTMRSLAIGLLVASGVLGAVHFLGGDEKTSTKPKEMSTEEMKSQLKTEGYVVLTNEELAERVTASKPVESGKKEETAAEEIVNEDEKVVYRTMLTVTSGMTSYDVGKALYQANVIKSVPGFSKRVESKGVEKNLRPGTFELQSDMTADEIIAIVFKER